jgi:Fe2+ transport system protein FeoA
MTVAAMQPGQRFVVKRVTLAREVGKRLADMGFNEGAAGMVVRSSFLRGPLHVRIRDYDLVLRRSEAAGIDAELISEAAADSEQGASHGR